MKPEFLLSFDLPKEMATIRSRLHRKLVKLKAKKIHDSLWKSQDLSSLISMALIIRANGGSSKYWKKSLFSNAYETCNSLHR